MMEGNLQNLAEGVLIKVRALKQVLEQEVIDVESLKRVCNQGVPDEVPALREIAWKILLSYLPRERSQWAKAEQASQQVYQTFIGRFFPHGDYSENPMSLTKDHKDDPSHKKDYELWQQIEKDVFRTHASIHFFSLKAATPVSIPYLTEPRRQKFKDFHSQCTSSSVLEDLQQQRTNYNYDYMTRILYIYSKMSPNIGYVQGMNQILAPLFFVVNRHRAPSQIDEAGCFFMLNSLLAEVINLHIMDMDGSSEGVFGRVKLIDDTLRIIEPVIWYQLKTKNVDPICYSMRWLLLLFAQQFQLFDVCRLWDTMFSYESIKVYLICLSLAVIQLKHKQIEKGDNIQIVRALQELRGQDIRAVIENANEVYRAIGKKDLERMVWENRMMLSKMDD